MLTSSPARWYTINGWEARVRGTSSRGRMQSWDACKKSVPSAELAILAAAAIDAEKHRPSVPLRLTCDTSSRAGQRAPPGLGDVLATNLAFAQAFAMGQARARAHDSVLDAVFDLILHRTVRRPAVCHVTGSFGRDIGSLETDFSGWIARVVIRRPDFDAARCRWAQSPIATSRYPPSACGLRRGNDRMRLRLPYRDAHPFVDQQVGPFPDLAHSSGNALEFLIFQPGDSQSAHTALGAAGLMHVGAEGSGGSGSYR